MFCGGAGGPGPGSSNDVVEGALGFPVERFLGQSRVRDEAGRVAGPAGFDFVADSLAGKSLDGGDDFLHRVALSGAKIEGQGRAARGKMLGGKEMRFESPLSSDMEALLAVLRQL